MSVFAAHAVVAAAVLVFSAAIGFLLFLLTVAVVAALLAASTALLVLLALTRIAAGLPIAPLLAFVLLTLGLLTLADILLLLPAILLDSAGVGFALLGLPATVLPGATLLGLTIFLLICHDHSPWLDAKETRVQAPMFLRREIDRPQFSIFLTSIMKMRGRPSRERPRDCRSHRDDGISANRLR